MTVYLDDRKLVKRLLAGDQAAFDQFFSDNYSRLFRFAMTRLNGNTDAAEDIAQAAMTRAVQKLATFKAEAALFTWLCAICRNEISDWLRQNKRREQHVVLTEDFPAVQAVVDSLAAPACDNPETSFRRTEAVRLIQVALDRLPARYGDVLEWKYVEGYSVAEIANRLGIGREATQSLIARAKRAFAEVYRTLTETLDAAETRVVQS
jgi:RNA polymerase sigma-70 factor (ECF subfamily)